MTVLSSKFVILFIYVSWDCSFTRSSMTKFSSAELHAKLVTNRTFTSRYVINVLIYVT